MEKLLLLLIVPVCWPMISRFIFGNRITLQEVCIQTGVTTLLVIMVWLAGQYTSTMDSEIWNGLITEKDKVRVSCSHSYRCNCHTSCTGSGDNRSCTEVCQTCYEHPNDWDWRVYSTVGEFNINRIDRRGSSTPPRWTLVELGEPASIPHRYTNYIKAVPNSLFGKRNVDLSRYNIPEYPKVYDYYRYSRVLNVSTVDLKFINGLNTILNSDLRTLGAKKEVNIIVVFTDSDPSYKYALESAWIGGKKNDVIIIVGSSAPPVIDWVDTITLGMNRGNELLTVILGDKLRELSIDNPNNFAYTITSTIDSHFDRTPMEEFEYLKDDIEPPTWLLIFTIVISLVVSGGLTFYFKTN